MYRKLVLIVLGLFFLASSVFAQVRPVGVYLQSAKIYMQQNPPDLESALKNLTEAQKYYPENPEVYYLMGSIYADKDNLEEMIQAFRQSLKYKLGKKEQKQIGKIKESKWLELFNQGVEKSNQDSLQTALAIFEKAIYIDTSIALLIDTTLVINKVKKDTTILAPARYETYVNAGYVAARLKEFPRAAIYYENAYFLKPDNTNVMTGYATSLFNQKEYAKSSQIYEAILQKDSKNKEALLSLAMCYDRLNDMEKANSIYGKLIEAGYADKDIYFNRGLLYVRQAQSLTSTITALRDSLEKEPRNQILSDSAKKIFDNQKQILDKAHTDFSKVSELDPKDKEAYYYLGFSHYLSKEFTEAQKAFENLTQLDPQNKEAWDLLSIIYAQLNDQKNGLWALANVQYLEKDLEQAKKTIEQLLVKEPNFPNAQELLAKIKQEMTQK